MRGLKFLILCLLSLNLFNCFSQQSHFWTTAENGEGLPQPPYRKEGIAFYGTENGVPIYRWVANNGNHFWTTDINGEGLPKPEYRLEGIAFYGANPEEGKPIYRWVANNGNHFWTTDRNGELLPKHIYSFEGIAFYGAKLGTVSIPIYRFVYRDNSSSVLGNQKHEIYLHHDGTGKNNTEVINVQSESIIISKGLGQNTGIFTGVSLVGLADNHGVNYVLGYGEHIVKKGNYKVNIMGQCSQFSTYNFQQISAWIIFEGIPK